MKLQSKGLLVVLGRGVLSIECPLFQKESESQLCDTFTTMTL